MPDDGAEDFDEVAQEPCGGADLVADINGALVEGYRLAAIISFLGAVGRNCDGALFL